MLRFGSALTSSTTRCALAAASKRSFAADATAAGQSFPNAVKHTKTTKRLPLEAFKFAMYLLLPVITIVVYNSPGKEGVSASNAEAQLFRGEDKQGSGKGAFALLL
jgi:hypothetical protein